jgi:hypothetical protein
MCPRKAQNVPQHGTKRLMCHGKAQNVPQYGTKRLLDICAMERHKMCHNTAQKESRLKICYRNGEPTCSHGSASGAIEAARHPSGSIGFAVQLLQHFVFDIVTIPDHVIFPVDLGHHQEGIIRYQIIGIIFWTSFNQLLRFRFSLEAIVKVFYDIGKANHVVPRIRYR